jgi:hypothetical protein
MSNCLPFSEEKVTETTVNGNTTIIKTYTLRTLDDGQIIKYNPETHHLRCVDGKYQPYSNMPAPPFSGEHAAGA